MQQRVALAQQMHFSLACYNFRARVGPVLWALRHRRTAVLPVRLFQPRGKRALCMCDCIPAFTPEAIFDGIRQRYKTRPLRPPAPLRPRSLYHSAQSIRLLTHRNRNSWIKPNGRMISSKRITPLTYHIETLILAQQLDARTVVSEQKIRPKKDERPRRYDHTSFQAPDHHQRPARWPIPAREIKRLQAGARLRSHSAPRNYRKE